MSALPVFDFPERLGAITVRELRAGLLGRDLVFLLIGVQLVLAIAGIYAVEITPLDPQSAYGILQGSVWAAAIIGLGFLFPLRALRALHSDRDSGLLELQQLTPLSSGGIVVGKFVSLALQSLLYLVTLLPFFALRYFLGGADLVGDTYTLLLMFGASLLLQALCFLLSTVPKLLRGLALVGLIFAVLFLLAQMAFTVGRRGFGLPASNDLRFVLWGFVWMQLGVAYLLAVAAQSISAPAENYVARARLALLAIIGWFALALALTRRAIATRDLTVFFALTFVALAVVFFLELVSERRLLAAQIPRPLRGGFGRRWLANFLLPGWHSALAFYGVLAAGLYVAGFFLEVDWRLLVLVPQGFALLLLPRLLLETIGRTWRNRELLAHLLLQLAFAIVPVLVASFYALRAERPEWTSWFPVTGFWNGLAWRSTSPSWGDLAGGLWAIVFYLWLAALASPRWREAVRPARRDPTA